MGRFKATDWLTRGLHMADDDKGGNAGGEGGEGGSGGNEGGGGGGNANNGGDGGKGGESDDGGDAKVTMTQKALDDAFADRATRGGTAALAKAAKDAGFDSVADMTAAAKATQERNEADKTDLEKANDKVTALEADAKTAATALEGTQIASALATAALAKSIPADRLSDAVALTNLDGVTIEAGKVTGADEAVTAMIASKPWIVGKAVQNGGGGTGADGGSRGQGAGDGSVDPAVLDMGKKLGITNPVAIAQAAQAVPNTPSNEIYIQQVIDRVGERNQNAVAVAAAAKVAADAAVAAQAAVVASQN